MPGDLVAVQGIGGLGHLGVQFANKSGYKVAAIGRGPENAALAKKLGRACTLTAKQRTRRSSCRSNCALVSIYQLSEAVCQPIPRYRSIPSSNRIRHYASVLIGDKVALPDC
jgi:D-arabinose 1-dehydrogenase-like Zn-dependent alcohol dehydrogenase